MAVSPSQVELPLIHTASRRLAWDVDTTPCHYCGELHVGDMTVDHIVPRSKGGQDRPFNMQPSCEPCNAAKKAKLPTCKCNRCAWAYEVWARDRREVTPVPRAKRKASAAA